MLQNNIDCQVLCIGFNFCFVSYHQCFELDLSLCFLLILISFKLFALDQFCLQLWLGFLGSFEILVISSVLWMISVSFLVKISNRY
ncbi:hypothetical protein RhiirB3_445841 [Rhizophagus irregularis]|nr:hypothetical protein RhiirB3_445841 [Rhizophagus irregularis]